MIGVTLHTLAFRKQAVTTVVMKTAASFALATVAGLRVISFNLEIPFTGAGERWPSYADTCVRRIVSYGFGIAEYPAETLKVAPGDVERSFVSWGVAEVCTSPTCLRQTMQEKREHLQPSERYACYIDRPRHNSSGMLD